MEEMTYLFIDESLESNQYSDVDISNYRYFVQNSDKNLDEEKVEREAFKIKEEISEVAIEENRALTDHELSIFDQYLIDYNGKKENPDLEVGGLTDEEERLLIVTSKIVESPEIYMTLESDKQNYETLKKQIRNIIETG